MKPIASCVPMAAMVGPKILWKLTLRIGREDRLLYSRASPKKTLRATVLKLHALHRGDHGLRSRPRLSQNFISKMNCGPNNSRYVIYSFRSGDFEATIEEVAVYYEEVGLADVRDVWDVLVAYRYVDGVKEWLDTQTGRVILKEPKRPRLSATA